MNDVERLTFWLPGLESTQFQITSPRTEAYNCIAWALDNTESSWDPDENADDAYWPSGVPHDVRIETLKFLFSLEGFNDCEDGLFEAGIEKIALYADGTDFVHVARQLDNGRWTSKLGVDCDIEHELDALVHPPGRSRDWRLGQIAAYMQRPRSTAQD